MNDPLRAAYMSGFIDGATWTDDMCRHPHAGEIEAAWESYKAMHIRHAFEAGYSAADDWATPELAWEHWEEKHT